MAKGRKAIPPDIKDNDVYKNAGVIEQQKLNEPKVDSAKLSAPSWLTPGAKTEWRRVVKLYKATGLEILNDLDKETLASYAIAVDIRNKLYIEWQEDEQLMRDAETSSTSVETSASGVPTKGRRGLTRKKEVNPILREIDRYSQTIRVLAEQLALTPVGRAAYAAKLERARRSPAEEFMGD